MKYFILSFTLLICCMGVDGQQDFNYTLFTKHRQLDLYKVNDSTFEELADIRNIVKTNTSLEIVDLQNTGNSYHFEISYQGIQFDTKRGITYLFYSVKIAPQWKDQPDDLYVIIDPLTPMVEFHSYTNPKYIDKYY